MAHLDDVRTLDEVAALAAAQRLPLHRRHDLQQVCSRGLVPATQRAGHWLMTRQAAQALFNRLAGLSITQRRLLYRQDAPLVLSDASLELPADLLVGLDEVAQYCRTALGWNVTKATLDKHTGHLALRRAGRIIITTQEAVRALFQHVWDNKLRQIGVAQVSPALVPVLILRLTQMLLGHPAGSPVSAQDVQALRTALADALTVQQLQAALEGQP